MHTSLVSRKTTKFETFLSNFAFAYIDSQELTTVDVPIVKAPFTKQICRQTLIQSNCPDLVPNKSNVLTNDDKSIDYRQFRLAYYKSEKSQFWSNSFKLLTESAESLNQFALSLRDYLYLQKDVSKKRIAMYVDFSECYFQICSVKIETKHKSISNATD